MAPRAFEIDHALKIAAANAVPCVRIEQPMNLSPLIDCCRDHRSLRFHPELSRDFGSFSLRFYAATNRGRPDK